MQEKPPIEKYVKHALELGACDAKEIAVDSIVTAAWVRLKCQYGCGVDVYQTVRNNGFPIEVVTDRSCAQYYYGVVLIE